MQATTVTRVLVWSRWLRLSHWTIALSSIGLIVTGWLLSTNPIPLTDAKEIHFLLSSLLLPALLVRFYLLFFGKETDLLTDCEPNLHRLSQALEVLRFYLTLGKAPLPRWFSHNPLWGPVYLLLFIFLAISSLSGLLLIQDIPFIFTLSNYDLHNISHYAVSLFVLLHLPAVFAHDLSNKNSDISGMVSGYKVFHVDNSDLNGKRKMYTVSLDELLKTKR